MAGFLQRVFPKRRQVASVEALRRRLDELRDLVDKNNRVLELIARAGEMLGGEYIFDRNTLLALAGDLESAARAVVYDLNAITGDRYPELVEAVKRADAAVQATLDSRVFVPETELVVPMSEVGGELADAVGEKMARLGALRLLQGCCVPDGFVVSAYACQQFLEHAHLAPVVDRWLADREAGQVADLEAVAEELRTRIMAAPLPAELERALRRALAALRRRCKVSTLAVRSSAIGEDGELSFAGQYESVLGVRPRDLVDAYKRVVASLYSPGVMRYRESAGTHPTRGVMPVGCLVMVPTRASGVLYTLDPEAPHRNVMVVSAARGLGRAVVEGSVPVDRFEVSREGEHATLARHVAEKREMYAVAPGGGIARVAVAEGERRRPAVGDGELADLAARALRIERYMKRAQDIEWAIDERGGLAILQARPLAVATRDAVEVRDLTEVASRYPVLLRNQGVVACRGIGAGPVHVVTADEQLGTLPSDVVLVARTSSPRLAAAVSRAAAVITDIGTSTGHLAAIAREFHVPTIVDTGDATQRLVSGNEVTVDAEENAVYAGRVTELLDYQLLRRSTFSDAPEFRLLRRMLKRVAPLNLSDPRSGNFSPQRCVTYHDIIRFAHEKAMETLADGSGLVPRPGMQYVRRLDLALPLDLIVVDLGGGIEGDPERTTVKPDMIASAPLRAVLAGLVTPGVWATGPADMDLNGFMSSMTRSQALTDQLATRPDLNVAVVSSDYLNLSLRLGYHFNIVDCLLSASRNDNYIYFRFAGGVTEMTRRVRRAALLRQILEAHDFVVEGTRDLVIARVKKIPIEAMEERLRMIGRLIGFSRQLDILLRDDRAVDRCVESFMEGRYDVLAS